METVTFVEVFSLVISILSGGIAIFSLLKTISNNRENLKLQKRLAQVEKASFYNDRNIGFEGSIHEFDEAYKLHGVNINEAKDDGVNIFQITYMIRSVNSLIAFCNSEEMKILDNLEHNDYRQRFFAQEQTQITWKYARVFFSDDPRGQIDKYLKLKHQKEYPELNSENS